MKKILISGSSISGTTLAYWLNKYGFIVTVIEKSDELRLGGQNIDVKGPALEIAKMMGILDKIKEANTTEIGLRWVNTKEKIMAEFPKKEALSMTQEYEILRGDLVQILFDLTKDKVKYIFGKYIKSIDDLSDGIVAHLSDGSSDSFDLIISAEGIGSQTRDLIFKEKNIFKYTGVYTSYFTVNKRIIDGNWSYWCNTIKGNVFLLRPDSYGNTRVCVNFISPIEMGYEKLSIVEQKNILIQKIEGLGWKTDILIKEIGNSKDLYMERLSQVKIKKWSKGRFVLVGDAAHCVTPLAGKGIDLAMLGPYILAGELYNSKDYKIAFTNYESKLKPYAISCQKLMPGVPKLVYPTSKIGVSILNGFISFLGSRFFKGILSLFNKKDKIEESDFEVPVYKKN